MMMITFMNEKKNSSRSGSEGGEIWLEMGEKGWLLGDGHD